MRCEPDFGWVIQTNMTSQSFDNVIITIGFWPELWKKITISLWHVHTVYMFDLYQKMEVLTAPNKNLRHLVSPKIENKQPVYHHTVLHWSQLYMLNRYRNRNKQFFILLFSGWTWRLCICSKNEGMLGNRQSVSLSCADLWKHKMSPFSSCKIKNKTTFFFRFHCFSAYICLNRDHYLTWLKWWQLINLLT